MKLLQKIKNYNPPKYICFLYFFVPIFVCTITDLAKENDIWFLLNHGKYVLNHGFPVIEPFSMHQGFSFVMQQWLTSIIFYLTYHTLGKIGLLLLVEIVNIFILYFLYKLCMLLSDEKYQTSILLSCITDLLLLTNFILPRPQIFTYLILIVILYIMELYYLGKSKRCIYLLPLLSLLQINLHASMWLTIFLFILPFLVCLFLKWMKNKKNQRIFPLLGMLMLMFVAGFINPYGVKNMTYIFSSYGTSFINDVVVEMAPAVLSGRLQTLPGILTFVLLGVVISIYIGYKKGRLKLRHFFLLAGVSILGLMHVRNFALLVIGSIPYLASYLKDLGKKEKGIKIPKKMRKNYYTMISFLTIYIVFIAVFVSSRPLTNPLEKGIDFLLKKNNPENILLYTSYDNGSYTEYRGLRPYIDTRAEVFLKSNNHKEDIMKEYYLLCYNMIDYHKFMKKYRFTHLIVEKGETLYHYLIKDKEFKVIYQEKEYKIFERIKK